MAPHLDTKETSDQMAKKQSRSIDVPPKSDEHAVNKSLVVPSIVPRDSPEGKDSAKSTGESITFSRTKRGMLLRPAHVRRPSNSKNDVERPPSVVDVGRPLMAVESGTFGNMMSNLDCATDSNCQTLTVSEDGKGECREEKGTECITERFDKVLSPQTPTSQEASKFLEL